MKKLFISLGVLVAAGIGAFGLTSAYFSDTETVEANTFDAGSINLTIAGEQAFTVDDFKPGDVREASVEFSAGSNDYYACGAFTVTGNGEDGLLDPETEAGDAGSANGELQNFVDLLFVDSGGNPVGTPFPLSSASGTYTTIADSSTGAGNGFNAGSSHDYSIKACFGNFVSDGSGGYTCEVEYPTSDEDNVAQTDRVTGTVDILAIQTRNNGDFMCSSLGEGDGNGDDDGEEEEITATYTGNDGFPLAGELLWQTEGRLGSSNDAANRTWEIAVGENTQQSANSANADYNWDEDYADGDNFSVDYNSSTEIATLTVTNPETGASDTVTYNVGPIPSTATLYIVGVNKLAQTSGTYVQGIKVDGQTVPAGTPNRGNGDLEIFGSGSTDVAYLEVSGASLSDGFTVTGEITYVSNHDQNGPVGSGSEMAFQIQVRN